MFSYLAEKLNVKELGEMLAPNLTPAQQLHAGLENDNVEKIKFLIEEQSVDPNVRNSAGNLPLHTAAYHNATQSVLFLLTYQQVDVNATGPRDNAALHFASSQGHLEMVKLLIEKGANPAARNKSNRTAYDMAVKDTIRQFLLPLQFKHEDPNDAHLHNLPPGITPTRDVSSLPAVGPPPPMGSAPPAISPPVSSDTGPNSTHNVLYNLQKQQKRIVTNPKNSRPIQADGFGSSVGNEELTAKFGNTKSVKATAPPPMHSPTLTDNTNNPYGMRNNNQYTTYDITAQSCGPSSEHGTSSSQMASAKPSVQSALISPPTKPPSKFTIFNPNGPRVNATATGPAVPSTSTTNDDDEEEPIVMSATASALQ